jgi:D-aspartate ligase
MIKVKKISVLIPDGEEAFLLDIVNCLSLAKNLKIFVMSAEKSSPMRYSRFIEKYTYYPKSTDIDWIKNIDAEIEKHNIDLILPVYEIGFNRLLTNQNTLMCKDKLCSLPSLDNFNTARNKDLLYLHMKANNLPCPKSTNVKPNKLPNIDNLKMPIIAKPVDGFGGGLGIEIFRSLKDTNSFFNRNTFASHYLVQEFIEGYDIDCSVLCKDGKILVYTIQKGNLQGKNEFAPNIGVEFLNKNELYDVVEKLMKSLNWSGVAHIDMRYDINDGTYKVIEINTRFWLTIEASVLAGVNFPYLYCLSSLKKDFEIPKTNLSSFLTLKGLVKKIKTNPSFIFKFNYIFNNTSFKFFMRDPLPMVYKYISRTTVILKQKLRLSNYLNRKSIS